MKWLLNLVEILKNCPKGMELDCTMFYNVTFDGIIEDSFYPIKVAKEDGTTMMLTKYGQYMDDAFAKCIIFPKGETTWEGFVPPHKFKDGDILSYQCGTLQNRTIYIYRYRERFNTGYYVALSGDPDTELMIDNKGVWALNGYNDTVCFATEDEKKKLFKAIKDNGYKWNAETKTLEKLVKPKFDPKTLKPFDKVLIRRSSENYNVWFPDFVSDPPNSTNNKTLCMCVMEDIAMVIPYNAKTKPLMGTDDEAPEYYRYWED